MLVLAPGRFSTTTVRPKASERRCADMRAMMSTAPPGAKPTMMRMGLTGQVCAVAGSALRIANADKKIVACFMSAFPKDTAEPQV